MNIFFYIRQNNWLLSLLSGVLLFSSFNHYWFVLIFVAFVPLLILSNNFYHQKISGHKYIFLSFLSFLMWNGMATWWISLASTGGALMAIIANSVLMCIVFTLPFFFQKKYNIPFNPWWLIPFWISFEYLHFHWDLMWPWLTIGNVFAFAPNVVQWYELTGTSGGSLWALTINVLLTKNILNQKTASFIFKNIITLLIVPVMVSLSLWIYRAKETAVKTGNHFNVLIVQPNIDPYNEKFYIQPIIQIHEMFYQIKNYLNDSIDVILLPETFITENIYEGTSKEMLQYESLKFLKDSILMKYPHIAIITGANTFKFYAEKEKTPPTARQNAEGMYYDIFNTALCIYRDSVQIFHKSKLVPGVEKMPYPAIFKPLEKLAIDLGGTTGSLGRQENPSLFRLKNKTDVATVICYESVFSDFVSEFFKLGAKTIFIITNDGWWGNTPGYYQHLLFGRLRAIENRTYIARCANTGISALINPLGQIEKQSQFWIKDVLPAKVYLNQKKTIYSITGDILSPLCVLILVILVAKVIYAVYRPTQQKS